MTLTADLVFEALACEDDPSVGVAGCGALVDLSAGAAAFTPTVVDALMYPDETAAGLAQLVPSVELLPVLDVLTPSMLEVDGQIDALVAVQRHIGLLPAR